MLYTVVPGHQLTAKPNVNCYQWRHDGCPSHWSYSKPTGLCLRLCTSLVSNNVARQTCVDDGGRLVNIKNSKENILIRNIMLEAGGGLHIGLKKVSSVWTWHLGENLGAFRSWSNGHPKSGYCVVMSRLTSNWYTDSCSNKRRCICQIVLNNPYGDC
ncbi:layilin-like [Haliotis asinina]|uniref:layilin-like n=1 Tax=Haliotis asinina TaxID=109174 RepID=UPI003531A2B6